MTRKDYIVMADAVRDATRDDGTVDRDLLIHLMCSAFEADNTRFDRERFIKHVKTPK